jgi:ribosomal protein S18 acetylase RimI-like enzyme
VDIVKLPVEQWRAYRGLRLRALKENPEAFSSSYAASLNQPDEFWERRLAEAADGERAWLLFAMQEDRLVGMIGAFIAEDAPDVGTIVSVYVPIEARRQGISTRLMQAILRLLAAEPALKKVRLSVNITQHAAIELYRRFGFLEIAREPSTTGAGQAVQQLVMERELPVPMTGTGPA